jgi:hypothetical protein
VTAGVRWYWLILQLVAVAVGIWAGTQLFHVLTT